MNCVWTVVECSSRGDIEDDSATLNLAQDIASSLGWSSKVVVVSTPTRPVDEELLRGSGVDCTVLEMRSGASGDRLAGSIFRLAGKANLELVVFRSSVWADDVACRLAALLKTSALTRCSSWRLSNEGKAVFLRFVLGGAAVQECEFRLGPCIVTFALDRARKPIERGRSRGISAAVECWNEPSAADDTLLRSCGIATGDPLEAAIDDADIIVAGGRGIGGEEGFGVLRELALALGGTMAGSRIAVDKKWIGRERQVGQTGKTVHPRLYVACGISGSSHHILGMKDSDAVVSINTDQAAPIHRVADVRVVQDYRVIVPALVHALHEHRARNRQQ
jgi:electron transfer flavoprotein alpha subunit